MTFWKRQNCRDATNLQFPYIVSCFFTKGPGLLNEESKALNKWCGNNKCREKMNLSLHLTSHTKINLRWLTDLDIKVKTTKPLEEMIHYLHNLGVYKNCLPHKNKIHKRVKDV